MFMSTCIAVSSAVVAAHLELFEDWQEVAGLVVEEALDDLFTANLAEGVQCVANSVGKGHMSFLWCLNGNAQCVEIGIDEWRDESLEMSVQNLRVFLKWFNLSTVRTCMQSTSMSPAY